MKNYGFDINLSQNDINFTTSLELILLTEVFFRGLLNINFSSLRGFIGNDINKSDEKNNQLFLDKLHIFQKYMEYYGNNKPFTVDFVNEKVLINEKIDGLYFYYLLLLLGYEGVKFEKAKVTKIFEKITAEAISKKFIGCKSEIVGAPSKITGAEEISKFLGIKKIRNFSFHAKDKGLDIISFYSIDKRKNKFIIFTQCAAGVNWENKVNDINIGDLRTYLAFSTYPLQAFSIATIFDLYDEKEEELGFEMGVIFDRPRLYNLLSEKITSNLNTSIKEIVDERFEYYKN